MEETNIIVMLKNMKTREFEREFATYRITAGTELMSGLYAFAEDGAYMARLTLTTPDVLDWEFSAIYDYFDAEVFAADGVAVEEVDNCPNPTWEFVYQLSGDEEKDAAKLEKILDIYMDELGDVMEVIKTKRDEYEENGAGE